MRKLSLTAMSSSVKKCLPFLQLIASSGQLSSKVGKNLIKSASRNQVLCIAEMFVNVLAGNLKVSSQTINTLARSKKILRKIRMLALKFNHAKLRQTYMAHYKSVIKCISECVPYLTAVEGKASNDTLESPK